MDTPPTGGRPHLKTRVWVLLIVALAAVCAVLLVVRHTQQQTGDQVCIYQDGTLVQTLPLSENKTLTFQTDSGGYNIVVIENGAVRISEASCPDQICVKHGPTTQTADPIVCLPNKLVVKIIAQGESTVDGVSS